MCTHLDHFILHFYTLHFSTHHTHHYYSCNPLYFIYISTLHSHSEIFPCGGFFSDLDRLGHASCTLPQLLASSLSILVLFLLFTLSRHSFAFFGIGQRSYGNYQRLFLFFTCLLLLLSCSTTILMFALPITITTTRFSRFSAICLLLYFLSLLDGQQDAQEAMEGSLFTCRGCRGCQEYAPRER